MKSIFTCLVIAFSLTLFGFDKRLKDPWNLLIGGQWQMNPHWQFRAEYGVLKSKPQLMLSANYRFGFYNKQSYSC